MRTRLGVVPGKGTQRYSAVGPVGQTARGAYTLPSPSTRWGNFNNFREYANDVPRIYAGNQPANLVAAPNGEGGSPGTIGVDAVQPSGWTITNQPGVTAQILRVDATGTTIRLVGTPLNSIAVVHNFAVGAPVLEGIAYDYQFELTVMAGMLGYDPQMRLRINNSALDANINPYAVPLGTPQLITNPNRAVSPFVGAVRLALRMYYESGTPIDITLRIAKASIRRAAVGMRRGLLVEPAQTNYITNPRAEGGGNVAPTGWGLSAQDAGVTVEWVGQTVVDGLNYQLMRVFGTAASTTAVRLSFGNVPATAANGLMSSVAAYLAGGSMANVSNISMRLPNATPGSVVMAVTSVPQRFNFFGTFAADSPSQPFQVVPVVVAGQPFDVTIGVAIPNVVDGDMLTMPILPLIGQLVASTRAVTRVTLSLLGLMIPQGGTLVFEGTVWAQSVQLQGLIALDDNTFNNRLFLYVNGTTNTVVVNVFNNGANTAFLGIGNITFGQPFKVAISFTPTGIKLSLNGGPVTTIACVVPVGAFTVMSVGSLGVTGSLPMNGAVAEGRYIQGPSLDAVLQLMSA